ncbi:MAG: methanogenesis marker 3 protein, partial [Methanoregula sp.]
MITIHLDGKKMDLAKGSTLKAILSDHPRDCAVGIIRPATQEQRKTANLAISTTAGEITVELGGTENRFLESPEILIKLALHWGDRYAAAFGPFPSSI